MVAVGITGAESPTDGVDERSRCWLISFVLENEGKEEEEGEEEVREEGRGWSST